MRSVLFAVAFIVVLASVFVTGAAALARPSSSATSPGPSAEAMAAQHPANGGRVAAPLPMSPTPDESCAAFTALDRVARNWRLVLDDLYRLVKSEHSLSHKERAAGELFTRQQAVADAVKALQLTALPRPLVEKLEAASAYELASLAARRDYYAAPTKASQEKAEEARVRANEARKVFYAALRSARGDLRSLGCAVPTTSAQPEL